MQLQLTTLSRLGREVALSALFFIVVGSAVFLLFAGPWIASFRRELKYLNDEIGRNSGRERERWIRRRRRLWLSLIPFVKYR